MSILPSSRINKVAPSPLQPRSTPLVIASSTGGPEALRIFLQSLPSNSPVGGVIVQHISAGFSEMLSRNLNNMCKFTVREVQPGDVLMQGQFLVAQGGHHLKFTPDGRAELVDAPPINSVKPAADLTMQTLAPLYQRRLFGIVLTGLGKDGLDGAHEIVKHNGTVLAQNRESSFAYFMPKEVTEAGLAQITGTPQQLAQLVAARSKKRWCQSV